MPPRSNPVLWAVTTTVKLEPGPVRLTACGMVRAVQGMSSHVAREYVNAQGGLSRHLVYVTIVTGIRNNFIEYSKNPIEHKKLKMCIY